MNVLRDYQARAVDSIFEEFKETDSTLAVAATGLGKTQIFCEVIKRMLPARSMVLVHREELCTQAVNRLRSFGIEAEVEMASQRAHTTFWNKAPCVVSSIQTQISGTNGNKRMKRFDPHDFALVVTDEGHHATSKSWREVLAHYRQNPGLKILGCTATPDRADEQALGEVFKTVACDIEILDGIHWGWLVPVKQQMVEIEGLDFSQMRTTAGDLNGADLAEVMETEKNLHGIADATLQIIGQRRAIVFTVSVKQAEMLSDIFNRHKPDMASWVCGKTPKDQRAERLSAFDRGRTQIMVNVGVLTEGYDSPGVEVIVMGRPTKSRSLYAQMVGRSTRPLPGLVEGLADADARKAAIAASPKACCLVVDFAGNSGRHKLMSTADILGGKSSDEAIERAKKRVKDEGGAKDMRELLEEEEAAILKELEERKQREAARRAHLVGKATFSSRTIDPFAVWDIQPERARGWDAGKALSQKQVDLLLRQGVDPSGMDYHQSKQILNELFRRWGSHLCTLKQANLLRRHGYETKDLPMAEASKLIDALAKNGWRRPA